MLVLCGIGFLFYSQSSFPKPSDKLLVNEKMHPLQSEIDDYRSKVVVIEYDIADLPESGGILNDIILSNDDGMNSFHEELIRKHGYNSYDYNVHFAVMDAEDTDDIDLSDDVVRGLRCGTMYTMSLSEGLISLNCMDTFKSPKMMVTGCVSYEHDTNGVRWGETGTDGMDCYTMAVDAGLTLLSGRCCMARGQATLTTSSTSGYGEQANGFCFGSECNDGDTAMGCGATTGPEKISSFSGAKRTQDDRTGATGCKAQRSTSGFLSVAPYCGILDDGALKCRTSYAMGKAEEPRGGNGNYVSRAECDKDMKMTDCDGEIKVEINHCTAQDVVDDHGTNYGGFIEKRMCVAVGDTDDIVAIATCCKVE